MGGHFLVAIAGNISHSDTPGCTGGLVDIVHAHPIARDDLAAAQTGNHGRIHGGKIQENGIGISAGLYDISLIVAIGNPQLHAQGLKYRQFLCNRPETIITYNG
jgi:hypothetical protein